jgi:hypothetical protein
MQNTNNDRAKEFLGRSHHVKMTEVYGIETAGNQDS